MDALESRQLSSSVYLWSDDNLSSDLLVSEDLRPFLHRLERYEGYGRVCCLKGIDAASFAFSTGAPEGEFQLQLRILKSYLETSLDLYGYVTLAYPPVADHAGIIRGLMDTIQEMREDFIGRIVPLRIEKFSTMTARLDTVRSAALRNQDDLIEIWLEELSSRAIDPIWSGL